MFGLLLKVVHRAMLTPDGTAQDIAVASAMSSSNSTSVSLEMVVQLSHDMLTTVTTEMTA